MQVIFASGEEQFCLHLFLFPKRVLFLLAIHFKQCHFCLNIVFSTCCTGDVRSWSGLHLTTEPALKPGSPQQTVVATDCSVAL